MAVATSPRSASAAFDLYLREIGTLRVLSSDEERALARCTRMGDEEAFTQLIQANLRFVVAVAKRHRYRGLGLDDLVCEGNIGLIEAARRFDESRGVRFTSYAVWWIRRAILQALAEHSRVVRVPPQQMARLARMRRRARQLTQQLGRDPSDEELSRTRGTPESDLARMPWLTRTPLSLDAALDDGDQPLAEHLPDTSTPPPDATLHAAEVRDEVAQGLQELPEREALVLRLYYGLGDQERMTLEEIGALLGVTRERARQIKERALARLHHGRRLRSAHELLEL